MRITLLGSGTSQGVPVIGCQCQVCLSTDYRDKRLRSSIFIECEGSNILIDIGPDFRQQMLTNQISNVDHIFITHEHNDHVAGLDDIRPINFKHQKAIPVYGMPRVITDVKRRFDYAFSKNPYPGTPQLFSVDLEPFLNIELTPTVSVLPIEIMHGELPILAFRIKEFAYLCDVSSISETALQVLSGLDLLIISALHHRPHPAHFTLEQALKAIELINPRQALITHMSHEMGCFDEIEKKNASKRKTSY